MRKPTDNPDRPGDGWRYGGCAVISIGLMVLGLWLFGSFLKAVFE